jgi:hypothetical protein
MLRPKPPIDTPCLLASHVGFAMPSGSKSRGFKYSINGWPVTFWTIADSM